MSSTTSATTAAVAPTSDALTISKETLYITGSGVLVGLSALIALIIKRLKSQVSKETTGSFSAGDKSRPGGASVVVNVTGNGTSSSTVTAPPAAQPVTAFIPQTIPTPVPSALVPTEALSAPELKFHPFFSVVSVLKNNSISRIRAGGSVRTKLVRDMCADIVDAWVDGVDAMLADNAEIIDAEGRAHLLRPLVSATVLRIDAAIEKRWRARGAPEEAIQVGLSWYISHKAEFSPIIVESADSTFQDDNRSRSAAILVALAASLTLMLFTARRSLRKMNGSLTGKLYEGKVIEPCEAQAASDEDSAALDPASGPHQTVPVYQPKKHRSSDNHRPGTSGKHPPAQ